MKYLVDGHNLIPKMRGMSLQNVDDELRLIEVLQVFCRVRRHAVEVFFDLAPPGMSGKRPAGVVVAHFVRQGRTADEAIVARLDQLGRSAQNWTVVTSDRQVQSEARAHQARLVSSEQFAADLLEVLQQAQTSQSGNHDKMSEDELNDWLKLFGG